MRIALPGIKNILSLLLPYIKKPLDIGGIATDSREVKEGDLFLSFVKESRDACRHIAEAERAGAVYTLSEANVNAASITVVRSLRALLADLAKEYLGIVRPIVIAITGSVGKTTLRAYLSSLLSAHFSIHATEENYNTEIGLPLTVLAMPKETSCLIVELGARHPGDIAALASVVTPDIGIVTRIGLSHLALFKTRENTVRCKAELAEHIPSNGLFLFPSEEEYFQEIRKNYRCQFVSASLHTSSADIRLEKQADGAYRFLSRECVINGIYLKEEGVAAETAALYAAAAALRLGMSGADIVDRIAECAAPPLRNEWRNYGAVRILLDCYNASPESMYAALAKLSNTPCEGKRYALLGEMRELGESSIALHREIGAACAAYGIEDLFLYGDTAREYETGAKEGGLSEDRIRCFSFGEEAYLKDHLRKKLKPGDLVLIKGSRALQMEMLIPYS